MLILVLGLLLFLGIHSISIIAPARRTSAAAALGENGWKLLYTGLSLAGFVMIIHGFSAARQSPIVLYAPPYWLRHVTWLLMLPVFPLLLAAYLPGRIKTALKHPLLAAVKFWAFAHLLSNGMLADVLLFGGFLAWAIVDRISLKRRVQVIQMAPPGKFNDVIAVLLGLILYAVFMVWAHVRLFGVSPLG